jgi:DNA-binding transcriptional ArsR family regulator
MARSVARYFHVLSDPTRVHLLEVLAGGSRNVSQLVATVGGGQSRVSNHLACLRWCGFVTAQRTGREVVYSLADPIVEGLLAMARGQVSGDRGASLEACRTIAPASELRRAQDRVAIQN